MTDQRGYVPSEWEQCTSKHGEERKLPDRFTLCGSTYYVEQWVDLYERFLLELELRSPSLFHKLPETPPFHSAAAYTKRFVRKREDVEDGHGAPLRFSDGTLGAIYCKSTMWVKPMFWNICELLNLFDIAESEMVVYLRADRDAE